MNLITKMSSLFGLVFLVVTQKVAEVSGVSTIKLFEGIGTAGTALEILVTGAAKVPNAVDPLWDNQASTVWWNLDDGVVVRVMDVETAWEDRFTTQGYDMIGKDGDKEFPDINMDKTISAWMWWNYDKKFGYVELFDSANYDAEKHSLFLSDFTPNLPIDMSSWIADNTASSMKITELCAVCSVSFYDGWGSPPEYDVLAWEGVTAIPDLAAVSMDNLITSFMWAFREPMLTQITPISLSFNYVSAGHSYSSSVGGTNELYVDGSENITISEPSARSYSFTTESSTPLGLTVSSEVAVVVVSSSATVGVNLSASFEQDTSVIRTESDSIGLELQTTVPAPLRTRWNSTFIATTGNTTKTSSTLAYAWYDVPILGASMDPLNNNYYKVGFSLKFTLNGDLNYATKTVSYIEEYLDKPTSAPTRAPTLSPTKPPTRAPTQSPTKAPTRAPTLSPTKAPTPFQVKKCKANTACLISGSKGNTHHKIVKGKCKSKCVSKNAQKKAQRDGWKCGKC